jgi:hypothetical protein
MASAQTGSVTQTTGADVIVGDLPDFTSNTVSTVNGVPYDSFAVGTTSCNRGNTPLNWFTGGTDNRHPAISQNIFRLSNGRFEQLGQGWLKHGFTALQGSVCNSYFTFGCTSTAGTTLGVGCSDPYSSGLNNGGANSMGPKWQVNAATGLFPYPYAANALSAAPRIRLSDLNASPAGSRFFIEGQYICGDDAAANNKNNNASWREIAITSTAGTIPNATEFTMGAVAGQAVHREQPAIYAWPLIDPSVTLSTFDVPNDGRFILACKVTGPTSGLYTYEYALHNLNSHRCAGSLIVPLPGTQAALTNVGFHDAEVVGEPNALATPLTPASDDWALSGGGASATSVSWAGPSYAGTPPTYTMDPVTLYKVSSFVAGTGNDHTANVIRWGSLFNFRFTSELAPGAGSVAVGLWRPGTGTAFVMNATTPGGSNIGNLTATCCTGATCSVATQAACGAGAWGLPGTTCSPDPCVQGNCCLSGNCSITTYPSCIGTWTNGGSCSPNPCPAPTGACCVASTCSVGTQPACSGTYQGNNSTCITAPCPSGNDACANASWIADGAPVSGTTTNATFSAADFNNAACGSAATTPDMWFRYKPLSSVSVNFNTCSSGYDTVLSLHTGSCGAFTQVACNDDNGSGNNACGGGLASGFNYTVTANTTYYLRVSGYNGALGSFILNVIGGGGVIPPGACCNTATGACTLVAQTSCTTGSTWNGSLACSPTPCPQPSGSCCASNGGCATSTQAACGGTWAVGGSCSPNICPQPGACCNGTVCSVVLQASCAGAFQSVGSACGPAGNPTTCCPINYNGTNGVSVQDIFDFLNGWFSGAPAADFNHANGINVQDIFDFLAAWFVGC